MWEGERGKVQRISSINGRHKIDRERLRTVGNKDVKELICTMDMN